MRQFLHTALPALCALWLFVPGRAAAIAVRVTDEAAPTPRLYTIGTVVGAENTPCYYYPSSGTTSCWRPEPFSHLPPDRPSASTRGRVS